MTTPQSISFGNRDIDVAADLWLPPDFDDSARHPALVLATPGSSVKGQIGANYASRLASHGFVCLTFDPSFQGESGGEPRDLEDPSIRVADLHCAADFLNTLAFVDDARIGMLGICAGGGYAVSAATTDHRFRAVGTVVAVDIGRARRQGAVGLPGGMAGLLTESADHRSAEAAGGPAVRNPWIPDSPDEARAAGVTDRDVLDAVDFYRTPRGRDVHSTNRVLARSAAAMMGFDAFGLVPELLTQPVKIIVGGRIGSTGSYQDGLLLWERARHSTTPVVIDGAGHYDLYDKPEYVDQAVTELAAFFTDELG